MWAFQLHLATFIVLVVGGNAFGKIGYFWHITDIHYDALFDVNGNPRRHCWQNGVGGSNGGNNNGGGGGRVRHRIGRFGDYNCDSPWTLIESAGRAMRLRQGDNIEFVLWTGDALSHSASKLSEAVRLALLQNVTDLLSRTFSKEFVFPVVGHADPATPAQLADLWRRWLPPEAMQTFEKGCYYTIEMKERKLRIIALNTNLWVGHSDRPDSVALEDASKAQWDWLESVLLKSLQNRETVYLVGHMAPGADERQGGALPPAHQSFSDKNNKRYLSMVKRYSNIIVGQFFGHLHSDTFRIIYAKEDQPISWIMMAPALTPRRTNGGANNPGLRLYKFDTDTGQVLDYTQFYLDLERANADHEADWVTEWSAEYNLTSYYALSHVTATSLHNLANRFTYTLPDENVLFSKYYIANSASLYKAPSEGGCDASCAHTHFCAITKVDYMDYKQCLEMAASALAASESPHHAATLLGASLLALTVTLLR